MDLADIATATTVNIGAPSGDVMSVGLPAELSAVGHPSIPALVRRSEAYYWTHKWQRDEAESRAALAGGDFEEFAADAEDPNDVIRWLFDESDEDV